MAAPFVTSVSTDKATYAKGEKITLTAVYGDPDTKASTVEFKATDASGAVKSGFGSFVVDPLTTQLIDPDNRVWTKQSDTGTVAVYTATA